MIKLCFVDEHVLLSLKYLRCLKWGNKVHVSRMQTKTGDDYENFAYYKSLAVIILIGSPHLA
jgi:hypothetical protein